VPVGERMIMSKTPLRISFAGGGTDIREYYREHGGAVVSAAINSYIHIIVNRKFDEQIRVSYSQTEIVQSRDKLKHPLVREALKLTGIEKSVEILSISDIPSEGTGLGSSSSFLVGLLNALYAWLGVHANASRLAEDACRIERDILHEPGGKQDQYIAAFGNIRYVEFLPNEDVRVHYVLMSEEGRRKLDESMMLFFTGMTRKSGETLMGQIGKMSSKHDYYEKMKEIALECTKALERSDIQKTGELLDENWNIKRTLSDGITNSRIDEIYSRAKGAGAYGGKITGAGGGGFMFLLVDPDKRENVKKSLSDLRELPVRVETYGSRIVYIGE